MLISAILRVASGVLAESIDRSTQDRRYCYQEFLWEQSDALWEPYRRPLEGGWRGTPTSVVRESQRLIETASEIWNQLADERYLPFTADRERPDCSQFTFSE